MRRRPGLTVRWGVSLAVAALLLPASAAADIVVHDGGVSKDRDAAERVQARTGQPPTLVLADDVLAGPSRMLVGGAELERCGGAPVTLDVAAKLDEASERVLSFELAKAEESLAVVETLLPCQESPVPKRDLARLSFLAGAARFDQDDVVGAATAMRNSVAADPTFEGERGFPRDHMDLLSQVREEAAGEKPARLWVWGAAGMAEVYIDGELLAHPGQDGAVLTPGRHLLQVSTQHGLTGMWIDVLSEAVLVWPGAGRAIWSDGGRSAGGEQALRLMISDEFGGREGDVHVLQYRGRRGPVAATYPGDGSPRVAWPDSGSSPKAERKPKAEPKPKTERKPKEEPKPKAERKPKEEPKPKAERKPKEEPKPKAERTPKAEPKAATGGALAGRFRVAATFGYQFAAPTFSYAMLGIDFEARVIGPLVVGAFVRPSFGGVHDFPVPEGSAPVTGPLFFMPFGVNVGVRKAGWLSPWVAGAFQYAYNRDGLSAGTSLLGFMVQGGLDIAPGDGMFIIRVNGEGGLIGLHFNARLGAGVGLRF
ncbi:MAG: hypothetical protein GY898_03480 [Proteobacteria bacterium]|nr:hypothetical protein [Pseudomonadota bacterium]